jgi:hypothetical protein
MYLHPWELNHEHPRLVRGWLSRLRTYGGLRSMPRKLERLLSDFEFGPLTGAHAFSMPLPASAGSFPARRAPLRDNCLLWPAPPAALSRTARHTL